MKPAHTDPSADQKSSERLASGLPVEDRLTLADLTDRDLDRLAVLGKISRTINESRNIDEVLGCVLEIAIDAMGAERGLVLLDRGGDAPEVVARKGIPSAPQAYSKSVVQAVMATSRPLVSLDVAADPTLSPSKSLHLMGTRSILCVPLTTNSRTIGLLYLDSRVRGAMFSTRQLQLAVIIADLAATAIERSEYFSAVLQNEKMAIVGNLLATIVHELNNPLCSILSTVAMLHSESQLDLAAKAHQVLAAQQGRLELIVVPPTCLLGLEALSQLQTALQGPCHVQCLPADTLLLMDNWRTFHGRTAVRDPQRHLKRVRFFGPEGPATFG